VANNINLSSVFQVEFENKKETKAKKVKNGVKRLKRVEEPNDVQVSGGLLPFDSLTF